MDNLGERIKALRIQHGLTLQELSEKARVSKSLLSQIERGVSVPTVTKLQQIAGALDLTITSLFAVLENHDDRPRDAAVLNGAGQRTGLPTVVRRPNRKKLITPWGAIHEMLCPDLQHRIEFILIHLPVGSKVDELYTHDGEECGVVLEGRFRGIFGDHEYLLEPGDSIYYDSSIPHRWENGGDVDVKAIWAITPPSF